MQTQTSTRGHSNQDSNSSFHFTKPDAKLAQSFGPIQLTSKLTCRNLITDEAIQGRFALNGQYLVVFKTGTSTAPELVLNILNAKLEHLPFSEADTVFRLILKRNGTAYELAFNSKPTMYNWSTALKNLCILTSYYEDYISLKMIGKGSFAKVYLVESKQTGKCYAAKIMKKDTFNNSSHNTADSKAALFNEIQMMRSMNHENIAKLYEVHESESNIYLILELIQGKSFYEILTKPSLRSFYSENQILEMTGSLLDAIAHIASKGIMHRDLKPQNILVTKNGKVKIVDFGLATEIDLPVYLFKRCGTPGYIAPEVFRYTEKDHSTRYNDKCDVFSVGCILYYFLFGTPLFYDKSQSRVLKMNMHFQSHKPIYTLEAELNNSRSSFKKEGLILLKQLLESDPRKRISALDASVYLSSEIKPKIIPKSLNMTSTNFPSYEKISTPTLGSNQLDDPATPKRLNLSTSFKGEISPSTPAKAKVTKNGSLYLEVIKRKTQEIISPKESDNESPMTSPKNEENSPHYSTFSDYMKHDGSSTPKTSFLIRSSLAKGMMSPNQKSLLKSAITRNANNNNSQQTHPYQLSQLSQLEETIQKNFSPAMTLKSPSCRENSVPLKAVSGRMGILSGRFEAKTPKLKATKNILVKW